VKTILFRADSSSTIGTGHIMRDLVLTENYPESRVIFATQDLEGNLNSKILESGHEIQNLDSNDVNKLIELMQKLSVDMVIIDHYGIDYTFEKTLKEKTAVQLMVFDDTYEKHHCDILLNHNIYADKEKYKGLVPKKCELRCGAKFTLLREEFHIAKTDKKVLSTTTKNIFLAMGGADSANLNISILEVLKNFPTLHTHVVTTTANQYLEELKEYVAESNNITLHVNSTALAQLMAESHLAIVTPSVTLNEVYFMGLPFIAIQTAENQSEMVSFLEKKNFPIIKNFEKETFHKSIDKFIKCQSIELINFTELTNDEKLMVLEWRNHSEVRRWMFTEEPIEKENHLSYIDSLKARSDRVYFLVKKEGDPIGVIDFTAIDVKKEQADIGLYANVNVKGVGSNLMHTIIEYGFEQLNVKRLISEVYKENTKAIALYERFGFKKIDKKEKVIVMELKNENR
jgi:UDP-2,4-diacetamido-2,4,6-trideoxy-beta-L-altropyranose hydrolase/UDP-4-amino-4,6-dideoxy-N-acetyl-beta-L-altrosamine N-acetyltransferase